MPKNLLYPYRRVLSSPTLPIFYVFVAVVCKWLGWTGWQLIVLETFIAVHCGLTAFYLHQSEKELRHWLKKVDDEIEAWRRITKPPDAS